jgi:hypothetical protein
VRTTYTSDHGTRTVGRRRVVDRGWVRADILTTSDGRTDRQDVHATGRNDLSNAHSGYHPECGWCWLGYPHTEQAHAARVTPTT